MHEENIIDYVRKICELLMASPSACNAIGKLLSHAHLNWDHTFVYLSTTNNTKPTYTKRVILQAKEDKISI